jgi:hypothetical protein
MENLARSLVLFKTHFDTHNTSEPVRDALKSSYKTILHFWREAFELFSSSGESCPVVAQNVGYELTVHKPAWKSLPSSLLGVKAQKLTAILDRLTGDKQRLLEEVQAANGKRLREIEQGDTPSSKSSSRENAFSRYDPSSVIINILPLPEGRRTQINKWLEAPDFLHDLDENQKLRHPGTCEWLLKHDEYTSWRTSKSNDILWLHGNPGSGKSVLASAVATELESERLAIYFFFRDEKVSGPAKNTTISFLRALAAQLLGVLEGQSIAIPNDFGEIYYKQRHHFAQEKLINVDQALKIVVVLLSVIPRIHIVVDALDECVDRRDFEQGGHKLFEGVIGKLIMGNGPNGYSGIVKWLFTSRYEPAFQTLLSQARSIEVAASHTAPDIILYLEEKGYEWRADPERCKRALMKEGNFLDAHLELKLLEGDSITCPDDLEQALTVYKPGFNQRYLRGLQMLAARSERERSLAK